MLKQKILEDIILFVSVINNKSFTAAGNETGLSKSMISKRITRLENALNARLLNRSTRTLALTQVGETLYEYGLRIDEELNEAEKSITEMQSTPAGRIKVHSPLSFGHLHLSPAISDFIQQYSDITVDLSLGGNMTTLLEGGYDMAIYVGTPPDSNHICRKLAQRGMRVCASPDYLKKNGTPKVPKDLREHNCLVYNEYPHHEVWRFIDEGGKDKYIKIKGNFSATSSEALREAAIAGLGIVKLPGFMLTRPIKRKTLKPILDKHIDKNIGIYAIYPHNRQLATKIRVFVDFLIERFKPEAYWN